MGSLQTESLMGLQGYVGTIWAYTGICRDIEDCFS